MSKTNTANVKLWLEQSEIDYFTQFVKAWIPFNAWYRHAYDALEQERQILDDIKTDGNRIRSRFMAKLEGDDPESQEIRNHIAALHRRLSSDPLENSKKRRISFERVLIGPNPHLFAEHKHGQWRYRVDRVISSKNVISIIVSTRGNVHRTITQTTGWNIGEFELHVDFMSLNSEDKARLRRCYEEANPMCFASLLATSPPPADALVMDGYYFVKDNAAIFAGLIEILYCMRNLLFHGELVPDPKTNRTYEPAYHLLRHLLATIV
ncbi:MAG: hypothetical protein JWQ71_4542 [Pedosphaera sp.]|nr:hypothetical protein [Pedosphaera sp.]